MAKMSDEPCPALPAYDTRRSLTGRPGECPLTPGEPCEEMESPLSNDPPLLRRCRKCYRVRGMRRDPFGQGEEAED